jgi:hypothetical protein
MGLFKVQLKYNLKSWLSITTLCLFYIIIFIFTSVVMRQVDMSQFEGAGEMGESLTMLSNPIYMLGSFFASMFSILALVFVIMFTGKVYTKPMETTSMACYLSLPISRVKYALVSMVTYLTAIFGMGVLLYAAGEISFAIADVSADHMRYFEMVLTSVLQSAAVGFIVLFIAFGFAGGRWTKTLTIAVPILLFVLPMFAEMAEWLEWLKWVTPYNWVDIMKVASGEAKLLWMWNGIYAGIIAAGTVLSCLLFRKRQLSI